MNIILALYLFVFLEEVIMEPPSPQSSPIKSPCPSSPAQSPLSSPVVSVVSSPIIRSRESSPIRSVPPSPYVEAVSMSPFEVCSQQSESDCFQQYFKRQKLHNSLGTNEATSSKNLPEHGSFDHCRKLFTEIFEEADANEHHSLSQDGAAEDMQFGLYETNQEGVEQSMQFGDATTFIQDNSGAISCSTEHEVTCSADNQNVCNSETVASNSQVLTFSGENGSDVHLSRERATSSSSSCASSSSSSSSGESHISATSSEGPQSGASSCEDEDRDSEHSEQEQNDASSDESDAEFFSPKIYEGCELSEDEGVLLLMDLFTKYKLSKKQIGGILKGVLKFIPDSSTFPRTEYSLFEYVKKLSPVALEKVHYYCSECHYYLGLIKMNCTICGCESNNFYQIPLADQIRNLFENHGLADIIDKYEAKRSTVDSDGYSDLLDGSEFKRAHVDGRYNLDLMGHTDGISVSLSSNVSLWPWEWVIAQLPPHLRFKYVLINGIWLDESKPYMNTFMKPLAEELKSLRKDGVQWTHPRTKVVHTTYVTACSFCADAPARAQLQNILSHGGIHCCHSCEQKMKKLPPQPVVPGEQKKSRRRVYTFQENPMLRTSDRMDAQGSKARNSQRNRRRGQKHTSVKGVKGPSNLSDFPGCDRSTAVFPEYMHLVLCLLKEFMSLWFEKDGPWSLKEHRDTINQFLKKIAVPDFITRIPRSTDHFSKWKANEFRSFLLFFSLIILSKCMKKEYFQHWMLLVHALFLLLQDFVPKSDVTKADVLLRIFCRSFAVLYKNDYYTYYIHQLSHLALTVQRHGPLHLNSAFMFESFNGTLAKYIHGTKKQGKELVNNIRVALGVEALRARILYGSTIDTQPATFQFKNLIRDFNFSEEDLKLLHPLEEPFKAFFRATIKHQTYTCLLYTRQKKRNNFTVCFMSSSGTKEYGQIKYFCQAHDNKQVALVKKFAIDHCNSFFHEDSGVVINHIIPVLATEVTEVINLDAILFKVIRVENYVCLRPNKIEYNL